MKTKAIYANLPVDTHRDLKAKLAQEGKTIQEFVQQAVEAHLKEGKK